jgi:hypothetical protein
MLLIIDNFFMKNKQLIHYPEINPQFIAISALTSISQTKFLPKINPTIKSIVGISAGTILINQRKKIFKNIGGGIVAGSIIGYAINYLNRDECNNIYKSRAPQLNSALININTGKIIQKIGEPHAIYVTTKNTAREGWRYSSKLVHCIKKLEGKGGGVPSRLGEPVLFNKLQNHTKKFNNLLVYWINYFTRMKPIYEGREISKMLYFQSFVDDKKTLDIKNNVFHPSNVSEWSIYDDTLLRYDDYGNILYGAVGTAFGFSEKRLLIAANINQIIKDGLDENKDEYSIKRGIEIFKKHYS